MITRIDPTRTTTLRNRFQAVLVAKFKSLIKEIEYALLEEDVLGLQTLTNTKYAFRPDADKVKLFNGWIESRVKSLLAQESLSGSWIDPYLSKAYKKGVQKAYRQKRKTVFSKEESAKAALKEFELSFQNDTDLQKARLLYSKSFNDLKGVTRAMSDQISRTLAEGLLSKKSVKDISKDIVDRVKKIGITRAKTLAQTEIVRANVHGSLDALEKLGVKEIGVEVEWSDAGDGRVCKLCKALANTVIPIDKAREMFPRHPRCRCSPKPTTKKSNTNRLRARIKKSLEAERSKTITRTFSSQKKRSRWSGKKLLRS